MRFEDLLKVKWLLSIIFAFHFVTSVSSLTKCTYWYNVYQEKPKYDDCFCERINWEDGRIQGLKCENFEEDSYLNDAEARYSNFAYFHDSNIGHLKINILPENSNFEYLYLNGSGIKDIQAGALSSVTSVKELYLQENVLSRVTRGCFNSLFHLKVLDLHSNQIKLIENDSFHGLNVLENLNLADNNLTIIPVNLLTYLYNLKTFNASRNSLKAIDFQFSMPIHIKRLPLYKNEDFSGDSNKMIKLDLSFNQIREIPLEIFKDLKQLSLLNISKNGISDMKISTLSNLRNLSTLNMHSLKLRTLDLEDFVLLTHLRHLNIEHNSFQFSRDILNFCPNLKSIAIDGNEFSCSVVTSMIMNSKLRNISMKYTPKYNNENIDGIQCIRKMEKSSESIGDISKILRNEIDEAFQGLLNNISSIIEKEGNFSEINSITNNSLSNLTMIISAIKSSQDVNAQMLKQIVERKNSFFNDQLLKNISRKLDLTNISRDRFFSKFITFMNRMENNNRSVENETIILEKLKKIDMIQNNLYSKFYKGRMNLENDTYDGSLSETKDSYNFDDVKSINESVFEHLKSVHTDPEENVDSIATKMDFLIVLSVLCYFTMFLIVAYIIGEKKLWSKFKNRTSHEEACNELSSLTN